MYIIEWDHFSKAFGFLKFFNNKKSDMYRILANLFYFKVTKLLNCFKVL